MTTTWTTIAKALTWCASCGKELREGDRALRVELPGVTRGRAFCQICALTVGVTQPAATEPERT